MTILPRTLPVLQTPVTSAPSAGAAWIGYCPRCRPVTLQVSVLDVDGLQEAVRLTGGLDSVPPRPDDAAVRPPGDEAWRSYRTPAGST